MKKMQETHKLGEKNSKLLMSVDLEDSRNECVDASLSLPCRVDQMGLRLLDFYRENNVTATFFVVGQVARDHPDLIKEIVSTGHEVGCHGDSHKPINMMSREEFKRDLNDNMDALFRHTTDVQGYRSPCFSLGEHETWAWDEMSRAGLTYSSSVLPANGMYYGWPSFGREPAEVTSGFWEIPMTLADSKFFRYPFAGGIYLRMLPASLISRFAKTISAKGHPVLSYVHPYDVDFEEAEFPMNRNALFNKFLFAGRRSTLAKLQLLCRDLDCVTHYQFVRALIGVRLLELT